MMGSSTTGVLFRAGMRFGPLRRALVPRLGREAAQIVALGERYGWPFRVLGRAPMLERSIFTGNWWLLPAQEEPSPVPSWALARVRALHEAGIRPKGFIIAHETPKAIQPGPSQAPPTPWWRRMVMQLASRPAYLVVAAVGITVLAPVILGFLMQVALVVVGILALPLVVLGLGAAALADPMLIAVTEDHVWIEIANW